MGCKARCLDEQRQTNVALRDEDRHLEPEVAGDSARGELEHEAETMKATERATSLKLHDGVRLRREVDGFPAGTEGAIVQVFPEQQAYGVELFEAPGRTIGLVDATADDLEPAPEPLR